MRRNRNFGAGLLAVLASAAMLSKPAVGAPGDIYVEFYGAKTSWSDSEFVGHAFACIALHLNNGIKEDCYGFYPKSGGKGLIGGPGLTASEANKNPGRFGHIDTTVKVKITEDQRRQILALTDQWNSKDYSLTTSSCIDFVHDAVGKTGLKRPDRSKFQLPADYMKAIDQMN